MTDERPPVVIRGRAKGPRLLILAIWAVLAAGAAAGFVALNSKNIFPWDDLVPDIVRASVGGLLLLVAIPGAIFVDVYLWRRHSVKCAVVEMSDNGVKFFWGRLTHAITWREIASFRDDDAGSIELVARVKPPSLYPKLSIPTPGEAERTLALGELTERGIARGERA